MSLFDTLGSLAIGSRLRRLSDMFMAETRAIYRIEGVDFEPRWFPLFFLLQERGQITVTEAAALTEVPHTYISQLVKEMRQAKLVRFARNPDDGRSRIVALTTHGSAQAEVLLPLWNDIRAAVDTILQSANTDFLSALKRLEQQLVETPTSALVRTARTDRITANGNSKQPRLDKSRVRIRAIKPNDDAAIANVIRTVMTEMGASGPGFSIHDAEVDQMSTAYAAPNAQYFVATYDERIIAGCGIAPLAGGDPAVCELKKMYMLQEMRGLGIGRALLEPCLERAQQVGYTHCYLETLNSMHAAHRLYERAGFTCIPSSLGKTGHFACDKFYMKALGSSSERSETTR